MERDGQGAERQCNDGDRRLDRGEDLDFLLGQFDGEGRGVTVRG